MSTVNPVDMNDMETILITSIKTYLKNKPEHAHQYRRASEAMFPRCGFVPIVSMKCLCNNVHNTGWPQINIVCP